MIDDVHTNFEINDDFINKVLGLLEIKPDVIYLESAFQDQANKMLKHLMTEGQDSRSTDDIEVVVNIKEKRMWIREHVRSYKLQTEFMVSYDKDNDGEEEPSCPSLAAASYLYRFGEHLSDKKVEPVWGEDLIAADRVLNMLSSYYVQVEDKAQAIVQAYNIDYLRKLNWFFY